MCDYRIVHCEVCQGEGRILRSRGGPDEVDLGQCWHCDGTGHAVIKVEPIEMEDLDDMAELPIEEDPYHQPLGDRGPN